MKEISFFKRELLKEQLKASRFILFMLGLGSACLLIALSEQLSDIHGISRNYIPFESQHVDEDVLEGKPATCRRRLEYHKPYNLNDRARTTENNNSTTKNIRKMAASLQRTQLLRELCMKMRDDIRKGRLTKDDFDYFVALRDLQGQSVLNSPRRVIIRRRQLLAAVPDSSLLSQLLTESEMLVTRVISRPNFLIVDKNALTPAELRRSKRESRLTNEVVSFFQAEREHKLEIRRSIHHAKRQENEEKIGNQRQTTLFDFCRRAVVDQNAKVKVPAFTEKDIQDICGKYANLSQGGQWTCCCCDLLWPFRQMKFTQFDSTRLLWKSVIKFCVRDPAVICDALFEQHDGFKLTGIPDLKNVMLAPRGVFKLKQSRTTAEEINEEFEIASHGRLSVQLDEEDLLHVDPILSPFASSTSSPRLPSTQSPPLSPPQPSPPTETTSVILTPLLSTPRSVDSPPVLPSSEGRNVLDYDELLEDDVMWTCADVESSGSSVKDTFDREVLLFAFCERCHEQLNNATAQEAPRYSVARVPIGRLPDGIHVNDALIQLCSQYIVSAYIKTYYKDSEAGTLQGLAAVLNLNEPVSLAISRLIDISETKYDFFRVFIARNVDNPSKKEIAKAENVRGYDLEQTLTFLRQNFKDFDKDVSENLDIILEKLGKGGILDFTQEFECAEDEKVPSASSIAAPKRRSGVTGEIDPGSESGTPPVRIRIYTSNITTNGGDDIIELAREMVHRRVNVAIERGSNYVSLSDKGVLAKTFAPLFPFGLAKPSHLPFEEFCRMLLRHSSQRFARNRLFLAAVFSDINKKLIRKRLFFQLLRSSRLKELPFLTEHDIRESLEHAISHQQCSQKAADRVFSLGVKAVGAAYGSDGERLRIRDEIFALMRIFGTPTWFISICPNTQHNAELASYLSCPTPQEYTFFGAVNLHDCDTGQFVTNLNGISILPSEEECRRRAQEDPVGCATYFYEMFSFFITDFLGWDLEKGCPRPGHPQFLGPVDYFAAVFETNSRGVLHSHMVIRIHDTPRGPSHANHLFQTKAFLRNHLQPYLDRTRRGEILGLNITNSHCLDRGCGGTLKAAPPLRAAYKTDMSKILGPPTSAVCNDCNAEWNSCDIIRNKCMEVLLPSVIPKPCSHGCHEAVPTKPVPLWCKHGTTEALRTWAFGQPFYSTLLDMSIPSISEAFEALLIITYQEHLWSHTTSCFKKCEVCRFGFPRRPEPDYRVDETGRIVFPVNELFEWINPCNSCAMKLLKCNMDFMFVCQGSQFGASLARYIAKYAAKLQSSLDDAYFQRVVSLITRKYCDLASETTSEPSPMNTLRRFLASLTLALPMLNELDDQLIALHLLYGRPAIFSHKFVRLNLWMFMTEEQGELIKPVFFEHEPSKKWKRSVSQTIDYRYRSPADEHMCLLAYVMFRKKISKKPQAAIETLHHEHPDHGVCSTIPVTLVPVISPNLPCILYDKGRPTKFQDHSACTPTHCRKGPTKAALAYQKGPLGQHDPIQLEQDDIFSFISEDMQSQFSLNEAYQEPPLVYTQDRDDISLTSHENDCDQYSQGNNLEEASREAVRESWARSWVLLLTPFRNYSEIRKSCESWWDAANRRLYELEASSHPLDKLMLQVFWNMNEENPDPEMRRAKSAEFEQDVDEAMRDRASLLGKQTMRPNSDVTSNSVDLSYAAHVIHEEMETLLEQLNEPTDTHRILQIAPEFSPGETKSSPVKLPELNVSQLYLKDSEDVIEAGNTSTTSTKRARHDARVILSLGQGLLRQIAQQFSLEYRQAMAFYVLGSKVMSLCGVPLESEDIPFVLPKTFTESQVFFMVTGQAGTGKSRIIKALQHLATEIGHEHMVTTTAYVGIAAINAGGITLHSLFNLSRYSVGKEMPSPLVRETFQSRGLLIIDEYGTLGLKLFARINQKLQVTFGSNRPFAGLSVALFGDPLQFHPVQDLFIHHRGPTSCSKAMQGQNLFAKFRDVINLTTNHRASTDHDLCQLLQRLRAEETFDDEHLLHETFHSINRLTGFDVRQTSDGYPIFLVPTNKDRYRFTRIIEESLANNVSFYTWTAKCNNQERILNEDTVAAIERYFYETGSSLRALPRNQFFIGEPVTITTNPSKIQQQYGIATGATGRIYGFQWKKGQPPPPASSGVHQVECPEIIFVEFDTPTKKYPGLPPNVLPIKQLKQRGTTRFKAKRSSKLRISYDFNGFPLRPRFASTYQAAQCLTCKNVVLVLPEPSQVRGEFRKCLYMGLSRATSLNGVRLWEPLKDVEHLRLFRPGIEEVAVDAELSAKSELTFQKLGIPSERVDN